ncbi:MAG: hypothetical protein J5725_06475 [Bacteroidales bacterium]|nr:hypothetical protein [Bacteroidales bacterium]
MQLVLNLTVDDDSVKDTVKDQLAAIKPEALQDALVGAIKNYFTENKYDVEKLIFTEGSGYGNKTPNAILKNAMASLDYSALQSVVDDAIDLLKNNYERVLRDILTQAIVDKLVSDYSFQSALTTAISAELYRRDAMRQNQ